MQTNAPEKVKASQIIPTNRYLNGFQLGILMKGETDYEIVKIVPSVGAVRTLRVRVTFTSEKTIHQFIVDNYSKRE